jgi:hypothetical protein
MVGSPSAIRARPTRCARNPTNHMHLAEQGEHPMSTEDNKTLVRRFNEEIFNRGDMAVVDELRTANYLFHDPNGPVQGPEGLSWLARSEGGLTRVN